MSTTDTSLPFHIGSADPRQLHSSAFAMIAFGISITKPDVYRRCARPGVLRAAEPDSEVYELAAIGSISRSYNALLERAAARDGLEALVLVHQDAEIVDADLCGTLRAALGDPAV